LHGTFSTKIDLNHIEAEAREGRGPTYRPGKRIPLLLRV